MQLRYGLISVDDHVQQPPDLWNNRLSKTRWGDSIPHLQRGTEAPGAGSSVNPKTGKPMDDLKTAIDGIDWLRPQDQKKIFEDNARKLYRL